MNVPGSLPEFLGFTGVVHVAAQLAAAGGAVFLQRVGEFGQQVGLGAEVTDRRPLAAVGRGHALAHLDAAVAVE